MARCSQGLPQMSVRGPKDNGSGRARRRHGEFGLGESVRAKGVGNDGRQKQGGGGGGGTSRGQGQNEGFAKKRSGIGGGVDGQHLREAAVGKDNHRGNKGLGRQEEGSRDFEPRAPAR